MKDLGKIALVGLPPALEMALLQQLGADPDLSVAVVATPSPESAPIFADLVIYAGTSRNLPPGVPALPLDTAKAARLGAILRQAQQMLDEPVLYLDDFPVGPYIFQPQEKALARQGQQDIALTDKEADILVYLAKRRDAAVSRDELLRHVWRYQEGIDTHTLETHIYRLRQKMEVSAEQPTLLVTVEGGYRLNL
jgi:DNA-binding CsgD family transcriptional regulator